MKQHILVVSQYFYPEDFRINDICKEWVKRGYKVTVLTGIPNYPQGKFYKGYNWFRGRRETYEGMGIIRIPLIPRGHNALMLMLNYISFVISGWFWKTFTGLKADRVFICEVSPMTQALPGVWYAKRRRIPCSIYVQDLWPENVEIVTGLHNKHILGAIDRMVDGIYQKCDKIYATSPSFVKRLEERESVYADGESKVKYWPQYAEEFYRPMPKKELQDLSAEDERFQVIFTGNIGHAQGLDILPKTARILRDRGSKCCFLLVGDGRYRQKLEEEIRAERVEDMFRLLGRKPAEDVPKYLAHGDVAFISFADNELFQMTIPAKLQSYLACGMPILAAAGGETARILQEAGCGICSKMGDPQALADAIEGFMKFPAEEKNKMRKAAIDYSKRHFTKKVLLDKMDEEIQGI